MRYIVCHEGSSFDLEQSVEALLKAGYRPVGGICVVFEERGVNYYQAMVIL